MSMGATIYITSSGQKAANTAILAQSGILFGVQADTGATVTVYDNASAASGTILAVGKAGDTVVFNNGVTANNGIYLAVSGANAIVYYTAS